MKQTVDSAPAELTHAIERRRLAQRVCDAHRGLDDSTLLAFVSGSVADGTADARSDVDLSVVVDELPAAAVLEGACRRAGGSPWLWAQADESGQQRVVAFHVDDVEVQIAYASRAVLQDQVDELLVRHNPDTPLHKLAEGILKAEPLFGGGALAGLQAQLADFPQGLAEAMARHHSQPATPWKALAQIVHRDAALWCRDLQVQAGYRLLGLLAAVNRRYYCTFQNKRLRQLAGSFHQAPPQLADRLEALLAAAPAEAARALHTLEGEVLALVAAAFPSLDLAPLHAARARFIAA